jgi:ribosomal protein S18 acetylase RimI-like enzyme
MTEVSHEKPMLEVREADDTTDASETAALGSAAFRETHAEILDAAVVEAIISQKYSEPSIRLSIRVCRAASNAYFLVAHRGSKLVGFLEYDEQGSEPELHRLYVDPGQKRSGIGSALLAALHERLPAGQRYRVTVSAKNMPALRFYERHGFRESGRATQQYPGVQLPPDSQPGAVVFLDARAPRTSRPQSQTGHNDPDQEERT